MNVYTIYLNNQICYATLEKEHEDMTRFNFFGNFEHLKGNLQMYHVVGDEIKLDKDYEKKIEIATAKRNLQIIRDLRKPLLQAFDTLENKYIGIQQGFIGDDEFPLIAEITNERWEEIKVWRNQLRDVTNGDLLNYSFPDIPKEVELFL